MLEALYNYIDSENQKDTKKKLTKNEPQRELDIVGRILKHSGHDLFEQKNPRYPSYLARIDAFDKLSMFADELEIGMYQSVREIENTKRLIEDLKHAQDSFIHRERDIANLKHDKESYRRVFMRAIRRLEENGIEYKDLIEGLQ